MDIKQLTDEELRGSIEEKLMSDWILIRGEPEVVGAVEEAVYPPGSSKNEDFVAYFIPHVSDHFFLGKKTDGLRGFLSATNRGLTDEEWEHLVQVDVLRLTAGSLGLGVRFVCVNDPLGRNISRHIDRWFARLKRAA
ncbi:MAG: hypothetical protein JRN45_00350 [Nitrososphaerota archaeon]|nr:hypothetical protein [Nitrososphaerota archaeon]